MFCVSVTFDVNFLFPRPPPPPLLFVQQMWVYRRTQGEVQCKNVRKQSIFPSSFGFVEVRHCEPTTNVLHMNGCVLCYMCESGRLEKLFLATENQKIFTDMALVMRLLLVVATMILVFSMSVDAAHVCRTKDCSDVVGEYLTRDNRASATTITNRFHDDLREESRARRIEILRRERPSQ